MFVCGICLIKRRSSAMIISAFAPFEKPDKRKAGKKRQAENSLSLNPENGFSWRHLSSIQEKNLSRALFSSLVSRNSPAVYQEWVFFRSSTL